ncbi:DUF3276 family protein [Membranihabitans marinus]|uniref:DUF3276 family protein n=1 Tax=Membranihabitans marinus TaxID=1227546 RepID=UPI001F177820|nr:DUF3276 family protein [Membranihabitans marinus]
MENGKSNHVDSVYSQKIRAGRRRTYFFDVKQTKGDDFYITMTESTKRSSGDGYNRHKIFLYKEDFNRFIEGLEDTIQYVKTELMPNYDYEEFDRRNAEWEEENLKNDNSSSSNSSIPDSEDEMEW